MLSEITHWGGMMVVLFGPVYKSTAGVMKGLCCGPIVGSLCKNGFCTTTKSFVAKVLPLSGSDFHYCLVTDKDKKLFPFLLLDPICLLLCLTKSLKEKSLF